MTDIPAINAAIENYLGTLAARLTPDEMISLAVTEDFRTGLRGRGMSHGIDGLHELFAKLEAYFDRRCELEAILKVTVCPDGDFEVSTRLDFFMRRWIRPSPVSEELSGTSFHTWTLRRVDDDLRVASLVIDGFANLNGAARDLIASCACPSDGDE